jgi:hypothetical protein
VHGVAVSLLPQQLKSAANKALQNYPQVIASERSKWRRPRLRQINSQSPSRDVGVWGALAVGGNEDGDEPWSEDDLFDLDSALSFGACNEEIAVFLRREVEDVERKAFERDRPRRVDFGDPTASIGRQREPLSRLTTAATLSESRLEDTAGD